MTRPVAKAPRMAVKAAFVAAVAALGLTAATPALAAGEAKHPRSGNFSVEGPFGTVDQGPLLRGY